MLHSATPFQPSADRDPVRALSLAHGNLGGRVRELALLKHDKKYTEPTSGGRASGPEQEICRRALAPLSASGSGEALRRGFWLALVSAILSLRSCLVTSFTCSGTSASLARGNSDDEKCQVPGPGGFGGITGAPSPTPIEGAPFR